MTVFEVFDDAASAWDEYGAWSDPEIVNATSDLKVAPEAKLTVAETDAVGAGDRVRFRDDGDDTVIFEGRVERTRPRPQRGTRVEASHRAVELFDEDVTLSVSGTDADVLTAALDAADATGFSIDYDGTPTTLGDDYEVEGRSVKRVFRDMVDRTGRVWWVGVDDTIHIEAYGARGLLASIDTATDDGCVVTEYVPDDVQTVTNDVTVRGTGGEQVSAQVENAASIDDFGRRSRAVNVEYIRSQGEATDYADALLNPDPDESATARVSNRAVDLRLPAVNHTLDVTDAATGLDSELVIEKQTVEIGSAVVELGEGAGVNVEQFNRSEKSKADLTRPGSVYGGDRIADDSISTPKLVDTAVIEEKLADLSVSETKVQDDSISTPKLQAGSVTANEILAGTITALEMEAGTLTANEVDTLDLDTGQLTVGASLDSGFEFDVASRSGGTIDVARMLPSAEPSVGVTSELGGSNRRLGNVFTQDVNTVRLLPFDFSDDSGSVGIESAAFAELWAYESRAAEVLPKDGSGTGNVGVTDDHWEGMRAEAYFEESPAACESVDLAELSASEWYDPPAYVAEGTAAKARACEGAGVCPDDATPAEVVEATGVELGHMSNYLLEACKAQQERIDEQADRIDALEAAVGELREAVERND